MVITPEDGLGDEVPPKIIRFEACSHVLARQRGKAEESINNKVELCLVLPLSEELQPTPSCQPTGSCKIPVLHK